MSDQVEKLRSTLRELHDELNSIDLSDHQAQQLLKTAMSEIEVALHSDDHDTLRGDSLLNRVRESARLFEESHPTLTQILGNIADALSRLGI